MPAYKDSKTGTWFVKFYCKDWTGENKQIKKRGYATKREALDYERNYKIRQENNLDMTFGEVWKLYTEDVKNYVKLNTWLTKEHIVDTKILPYFRNLKMNEITPGDVRKWQNEMVAFRYENGKCYSQTYKKTMHNILSAIFNHACRFYNLKSNPARQAGNMGREEKKEMLFWTTEEYKKFYATVQNKMHYAVHGNTAAEVIVARADHNKEHMGLKSWKNAPDGKIVKTDVSIAKNYLEKEELAELNEIVTMYLDYATRQARRHIPMTMEDWKTKLDAFLRFNDAEVLQDKGKVTAAIAKEFAESEFEKYRVIQDSLYESDFDKLMNDMEKNDAIH